MSFYANNKLARANAKNRARGIQKEARDKGASMSFGKALEMVAVELGYRDWNTASARISNYPDISLQLGDHIRGTYLKQEFTGRVVSVSQLGEGEYTRLSVQLDEPVDVVTFDSFSAWRRRISGDVNGRGTSPAKTSDGQPHIEILGHVHT